MLFLDRLRNSAHILGLIFHRKLVVVISNWVLNCASRHKVMPGQPKLMRNFFWCSESDGCQSRRHIYRAVAPWCAMYRNDCSELWKMKFVCAHIDHRSLFLLKTQWQQSRDVFIFHNVLQHPRESVDHSRHHHRSCGICCTSHPFWCHHFAVNPHTTKTSTSQLLLPSGTCGFFNQRLSCCTAHYQVSRRDPRRSRCPCCVLVVLATPGSRTPDRLLIYRLQKRQS